jgi:phosphoribosylcarboxyaminoimidazole (NCAIR) mutase
MAVQPAGTATSAPPMPAETAPVPIMFIPLVARAVSGVNNIKVTTIKPGKTLFFIPSPLNQ